MNAPRAFVLSRREDVSGVSGTGIVAQGVMFADGSVALRWLSDWPTSVVFHDRGIESVRAIHGHDGRTEIVWTDNRAARASAEAADELVNLRTEVDKLRDQLATKTSEFDALCVRAEKGGISEDEIDRIADAAWIAVQGAMDRSAS